MINIIFYSMLILLLKNKIRESKKLFYFQILKWNFQTDFSINS